MKQILLAIFFITFCVSVYAQPYILILGTAQDGGYPHIGCKKECCRTAWTQKKKINVVSFALIDPDTKQWWLFEATPDIKEQLQLFQSLTDNKYSYLPNGIFLTHAHMGHYTGLMQLGREALGAKNVPVYALPKLKAYLETNGPWSQLVTLNNITLQQMKANDLVGLSKNITVQPFTVPHRDEYSETAGYRINTGTRSYLFIPDINKWSKWEKDIIKEVNNVDVALVDATFYDEHELPGKRMSEVPHPFVQETMELFSSTPVTTKSKVHFIHMNHTNPMLWNEPTQILIRNAGYNFAQQGAKL